MPIRSLAAFFLLLGSGLGVGQPSAVQAAEATGPGSAAEIADAPLDRFFDRLRGLCGQAFAGHIEANLPPPTEPDAFEGKALVMHVRDCEQDVLRIPFHVGDDHSRTWVLTRSVTGLQLKHDHRHADGSSDAVTMYGGDTARPGTVARQEFPVDAESVANFTRNGLSASLQNVWAIEIEPGQRFVYELARPSGRLFRVAFDLTQPVALPPVAWGYTAGD